jgi:beta-lactamase family protein
VPGIVVLVAGPEGVRAAGGAGLADIAARIPASPGMVCPWFSMTKIVTATELDGARILSPQSAAAMREITMPRAPL